MEALTDGTCQQCEIEPQLDRDEVNGQHDNGQLCCVSLKLVLILLYACNIYSMHVASIILVAASVNICIPVHIMHVAEAAIQHLLPCLYKALSTVHAMSKAKSAAYITIIRTLNT